MCSKNTLEALLRETTEELKTIFGSRLDSVILYGSYARGDYDDESDIDVMALVDMDRQELAAYRRPVSDFSSDLDLKYDVLLSIKLQDKATFEKYLSVLPFFKNVIQEGVVIHE